MPSFRLEEVAKGSSFEEIISVYWVGNKNPRNTPFEFVFPVRGASKEAYNAAKDDCRVRISSAHSKDPSSHWIQIVDDDNNGTVVATSEVHIYDTNEKNPHAKDSYPPTDISWEPEGDRKKFIIRMFDISLAISRARKRRPHIAISNCVTDPKYRRQGAATMLVDWVARKADELGIECFVPAHITMGVPLYNKVNFVVVDRTILDMNIPNPSEEWKKCQQQLGMEEGWDNMWRPINGKYKTGEKFPWE